LSRAPTQDRLETDRDTIEALDTWIGSRLPGGAGALTVTRMGEDTGASNSLYWISRGAATWVLRRPPARLAAPTASNVAREWRLLSALKGSTVPHAEALLFSDGTEDGAPLDGPFLILEAVDGLTPVGVLPPPYDTPAARQDLGLAMADGIAELASFDWRAAGLEGFGRPDGFLARQVSRWRGQHDGYATREIVGLDRLSDWLEANRPPDAPPAVMHGDYSVFNVIASRRDTGRLAAILDWDTATVGDPMLDLGLLLGRWTEPGERPALGSWDIGDGDPVLRAGLPTRKDIARRYAERSGRDLSALPYYTSLALFKLALILEGRVGPLTEDGRPAEAEKWRGKVDNLIATAWKFASGSRR
jgi:aminoglycoside phosphotransferase (APT) family kinase protein